jgi:hypothetical protein
MRQEPRLVLDISYELHTHTHKHACFYNVPAQTQRVDRADFVCKGPGGGGGVWQKLYKNIGEHGAKQRSESRKFCARLLFRRQRFIFAFASKLRLVTLQRLEPADHFPHIERSKGRWRCRSKIFYRVFRSSSVALSCVCLQLVQKVGRPLIDLVEHFACRIPSEIRIIGRGVGLFFAT